MSASPTNASLELTKQATSLETRQTSLPVVSTAVRSHGFDALQALLAFSSLHEQIRQRREREKRDGTRSTSDNAWELNEFLLDEVLQLVAERALAITGADGIAIALAEGDEIICRASSGTIAPDAGARLDPNSGFSGSCFRSGKIVRCDDSESDARVNVQACRRLGARSMMAVPLAGQHNVLGLLEAFSTEAHAFNDSDVRSLNLLAELILAAMRPEEEDRLAEISRLVTARADGDGNANELDEEIDESPGRNFQPEAAAVLPVAPAVKEDNALIPTPGISPVLVKTESSRPGLIVVLVLIFLAAGFGGFLWWKVHSSSRAATVPAENVSLPAQPSPSQDLPAQTTSNPASDAATIPSQPPASHSGLPQVLGVRHWSSADSSTVVIDLEQQVQYEAHRLADPDRIYFDLHDTSLATGLFGKTIEVQDALLARVRLAQPTPGVTRVVLETKVGSNFSVSLEADPYRLVVEVHGPRSKPETGEKLDLFLPNGQTTKASARPAPPITDGPPAHTQAPQLRIVLDAGHGGWDLGTVGRKGLMEKDLVLDVVDRVGNLLQKRLGADVIYTREDDTYVALEKRAEIANLAQATLFMSVHANYSNDPSARGVETYYSNTYSSVRARTRETDNAGTVPQNISWTNVDIREKVQESRKVAASIQHELYGMLSAKNPGIRNRGVKEASYVVLTGTSMPAILAEVSFVSSPTDEKNLQSETYRQQIAEALYKGLAKYAGAYRRDKLAAANPPLRHTTNPHASAALLVR